jgi:hypothetical protein
VVLLEVGKRLAEYGGAVLVFGWYHLGVCQNAKSRGTFA